MTGWGQRGPWVQAAGHDINYIALSGWWESKEQARAAFAGMDREAGRLLMEDERHFIDLERSQLFVTREHIIY